VELYLHSQYVLITWCLVKHRDNFTVLYFYLFSLDLEWNHLAQDWDQRRELVNTVMEPSVSIRNAEILD